MKNYLLFQFVFVALFCVSCSKDLISTDYDKSYQAWLSFKSSSHNSYTYTAFHGSVFGGYQETFFLIKAGHIVSRKFSAGVYKPNTGSLVLSKTWTEELNALNTHGIEGDELLTLDDVYAKAETVWLKADKKQNEVYFEAKNNGMISLAGYVPNGCQDDCLTGTAIKKINPM